MSAMLECMTATLYSASLQPAALQQTNPRSSTRRVSQQPAPNFPATESNQYPPNSSVRISSSSTPAFVSISRIAATMAGGPAT